jgi:putative transcriptional regulator
MTLPDCKARCHRTQLISAYALRSLPVDQAPALDAHLAACSECRSWLDALRPVVDSFAFWPTADLFHPRDTLRLRLAERIAADTGKEPVLSQTGWTEPAWEQAAPGITVKLLATDAKHDRVSMLVRLAPGVEYPPHTHAGREELHLLDGELWIDERKLCPGDYNRAEKGTADKRVWSETGCMCLLITSTQDKLGEASAGERERAGQ